MSHATPNRELISKWIDALLSGKYHQGKHVLRSVSDNYCCLGVLADIAIDMNIINGKWSDGYTTDPPYDDHDYDIDGDPTNQEPNELVNCYALQVKERDVEDIAVGNISVNKTIDTQSLPHQLVAELGFRLDHYGGLIDENTCRTKMMWFETPDDGQRSAISLAAANDIGIPFASIAKQLQVVFADVLQESSKQ